MRKIVLGLGVSLDLYIARKNGALDFLSMDWDYEWNAFFKTIDTVLMGRKTLETVLKMFPKSKRGKNPNPYPGMANYVFSRRKKKCDVEGIELVSGDLKTFVAKLKKKKGKNIWLSGGGELARSFLEQGLIDEISLGVVPVLIGSGIPLFPALKLRKDIQLRLIECVTYKSTKEKNAMVGLKYEVKK
jgi:dihydrofolate reductase